MSATALTLAAIALLIRAFFTLVAGQVPVAEGAGHPPRSKFVARHCDRAGATYGFHAPFSLVTHKKCSTNLESMQGSAQAVGRRTQRRKKRRNTNTRRNLANTPGRAAVDYGFAHRHRFCRVDVGILVSNRAGAWLGLTEVFVGVIIVAIIGNAAEESIRQRS